MISHTKQLYLLEPFLSEGVVQVVDVVGNGVIVDQTVVFPQSQGQAGDHGHFIFEGNHGFQKIIPILYTKREKRKAELFSGFPLRQVETPIIHYVADNFLPFFVIGSRVRITIDVIRRAWLTVNHTGLHLVLMGFEQVRPNISRAIRSSYIGEEFARVDFFAKEAFSSEEIKLVARCVNDLVGKNLKITQYSPEEEQEIKFWKCQDTIYCCGGRYWSATKNLGKVWLERKNIGRGLERIMVFFPEANLPLDKYYTTSQTQWI
jgi:alanyl-tRNA synthetase